MHDRGTDEHRVSQAAFRIILSEEAAGANGDPGASPEMTLMADDLLAAVV